MEADDNAKRKTSDGGIQRRHNKPLIEKRRRARINQCLTQLKALVLKASQIEAPRAGKLEKADILELTVNYVRRLHDNSAVLTDADSATDVSATEVQYRAGYERCVAEVLNFLKEDGHMTDDFRSRISAHCRARLARSVESPDVSSSLEEAGSPSSFRCGSSALGGTVEAGTLEVPTLDELQLCTAKPKSEKDLDGREDAAPSGMVSVTTEPEREQKMDCDNRVPVTDSENHEATSTTSASATTTNFTPCSRTPKTSMASTPQELGSSHSTSVSAPTGHAQPVRQLGNGLRFVCGSEVLLLVDPSVLSQHALVPLCRVQSLQPVSQATVSGHVMCTQPQTVMTSPLTFAAPSVFSQVRLAASGLSQPLVIPATPGQAVAEASASQTEASAPCTSTASSSSEVLTLSTAPLLVGQTTFSTPGFSLGGAPAMFPASPSFPPSSDLGSSPSRPLASAAFPVGAVTSMSHQAFAPLPVPSFNVTPVASQLSSATSSLLTETSPQVTRSSPSSEIIRGASNITMSSQTAFSGSPLTPFTATPHRIGPSAFSYDRRVLTDLHEYAGLSEGSFSAVNMNTRFSDRAFLSFPPSLLGTAAPALPMKTMGDSQDLGMRKEEVSSHVAEVASVSGAVTSESMWQPWT